MTKQTFNWTPLTPEEGAEILLNAKTMDEIRKAGDRLGMSFSAAYAARKRLVRQRWGI